MPAETLSPNELEATLVWIIMFLGIMGSCLGVSATIATVMNWIEQKTFHKP